MLAVILDHFSNLCKFPSDSIEGWIAVGSSDWSLDYFWDGECWLEMLDKPGGMRTTRKELLSWISSLQPVKSTGGKIRVRGTVLQNKG